MRASQWLLGLATTSAIVGALSAIGPGCGGSTSNGGGAKDSGTPDVTAQDSSKPETGPEAAAEASKDAPAESAPTCTIDADITDLNIPDAEIGDSSASTDGCYTCIKTTCGSELSSCNTDCTCNGEVAGLLSCIGTGGAITTCGAGLLAGGANDPAGLALLLCVAGSAFPGGSGPGCTAECGYTAPPKGDGGGNGEGGGGGDGGGDAAGE
ncbi:MAG TPA: hypothetical protein VGG39_33540 [Polyangiaceae bacterium]|jgi:hypothetical protein